MTDERAIDARDDAETTAPARRTDWAAEVKGIVWLVLAVLGFHSLVAKPFYIPSESMMPGLLVGDRLVVTKFPYGYSFVTPTFHLLPPIKGRLLGSMPERGDVVIVTPPGTKVDWIKRVVGLPGDRIQVQGGVLYLNGRAVPRRAMGDRLIPVDANTKCTGDRDVQVTGSDGRAYCRVAIFRETLPGGRSYDTIDMGWSPGDDYGPSVVPADHVFLMGDNRDNSADSRFSAAEEGLGGAVPWENIGGRAEFITFSLDGSATLNPLTWPGSFRSGRAGTSLHPQKDAP
ncbi:signal peptidase I [Sphingomonas sp. RS2018]